MAMGGWVARAISEILKLHVPDTLQANGLMTARQLVERGLQVNAGALERVMRACASVGLLPRMGWWDYLNANPQELATFGEAMKANSQNSMRGVLENCDLNGVKKIADLGGGFGHLVIALLEKYPSLLGIVVDLAELIPVAEEKNPAPEAVAPRLEYQGQDFFKRAPVADAYIMSTLSTTGTMSIASSYCGIATRAWRDREV
jgi:hypothetical protein